MGHTTLQTQYLTIPVYMFGGLCFLIFAYFSDRMTLRSPVSQPPPFSSSLSHMQ